jgi:23S rRNA pseudouridine1911/1915/1917 synthase
LPHSPVKDRILHEDNHVIVVNKEVGELVQGDETGDSTLGDAIKAYLRIKYKKPGEAFLGVVHRLDRPTTGAVMFAKTSKGLSRMTEAFRERQVEKIYWALVEKQPPADAGTLKHWLFKDKKNNKAIVYKKPRGDAKEAILHYELIGHITDHYLLEIKLETGRPHQIRAQLATMGCPITGDAKYGYHHVLKDKGIALHARNLNFTHPTTKERVELIAPTPSNDLWRKFT